MAGPTLSIEGPRGCGYRKEGGIYLMGGKLTDPCGRLPFELHACPTCGGGWRQARGWKWIEPRKLLAGAPPCRHERFTTRLCGGCPMGGAAPERAGLMWIGEKFYTVASFTAEAAAQGISKRVAAVPKGVEPGVICYLAHPQAVTRPCPEEPGSDLLGPTHEECERCGGSGEIAAPGLFTAFAIQRVEKIVRRGTPDEVCERLRAKGIEPVVVERAQPRAGLPSGEGVQP